MNKQAAGNSNPNTIQTDKVWRDGEYLVMHEKKAVLPRRCAICNTPINGKLVKLSVRNDSFISRIMILLASPFAGVMAPRTNFRIGLCRQHIGLEVMCQRIFQLLMCMAFFGMIIGLALIFRGSSSDLKYTGLGLVMTSMLSVYIAVFFGFGRSRPVKLAKIDKPFVWVKGVSPEYLESLPELPYSR